MAKLILTDVANLQNESTAITSLASNNNVTEIAMENTLSRDGLAPNQMLSNLDMNNYKVINLPNALTDQEPATFKQLRDAKTAPLGQVIGTDIQAWDTDLDAVAGLSTTGLITRTGAGTAASRTLQAPAAGFTITNPAGIAGDPTFVLANDLAAVEGLSGTGLIAHTAANTMTERTLTAPAAGITITNPAGIAGNPTLVLANDLSALEGLSTTGIARRTGTDTWTASNAVTNAELNTMGAFTFKGNNTSGTATPTDVDIHALTLKGTPAGTDEVIISDQAASGAWKRAAVSSLTTSSVVSSIAGNTGAFTLGTGLTNSVNDIRTSLATASNVLGSDVAMGAINNLVDGPSMAQGTSGTWFVSGGITAVDSVGISQIDAKLWDGTTVIASGSFMISSTATVPNAITLSGFITNPAANIKISAKNASRTTGTLKFNSSGSSKDCYIFGIRIA